MPLSQSQMSLFVNARKMGAGGQAVSLDDPACRAIIGITLRDLGQFEHVADLVEEPPELFAVCPPSALGVEGDAPLKLFMRLVELVPMDGDSYFACLAKLHTARLKYERILATQPLATSDQVGPRGLLQFGLMPSADLAALLMWRKWMFDIDNRAAQETGYLFEPIMASAIGGVPVSARKSPVRRRSDPSKGRQVDCLRLDDKGEPLDAYEIKMRVTIAASGQGRWGEEKEFPGDCKASGLNPVLVVLDPTDNPKLKELVGAFEDVGGRVYVGGAAWEHLEAQAGPTMAVLLERYVRDPLSILLEAIPEDLPELTLAMNADRVVFSIEGRDWVVERAGEDPALASEAVELPEDVDGGVPGVS